MRKRILVFLSVILLAAAAVSPAGAAYKRYQITEGNWWSCFPLDAHNTVAACELLSEENDSNLWYVYWYRDGEIYRELTGTIQGISGTARLAVPYPAIWDGEHLSMYYCVLKEELKTYQQGTWIPTQDPGCFDVFMADWTENGLENERLLSDAWFDIYDNNTDRGMLAYTGEKGRTAVYHGRETVLPDSIPVNLKENILSIHPVDEGVYLVKVMDNAAFCTRLVCVDHGTERYRITLPRDEILPGRTLMPDKRGGFFCMEGYRSGDYSPEYLNHYGGDGQYDCTLVLSGSRVVVHVCASTAGPDGLCTLYGIAVANSRKVYTVFAMTLDENLNVTRLDVRKIDPAYGDYGPEILIASDGTPYVFIECYSGKHLWPVLIPFSELKKSNKTYGLKLVQQ